MAETTRLPVGKELARTAAIGWPSLDRMRREIDRLLEDVGRDFLDAPTRWSAPDFAPFWRATVQSIAPVIDVTERPGGYEITAELPGLDEKDIQVRLSNGNLTISGEKREAKEDKDANYHLSERRYGSFQRNFRLPDGVNPDKIEASFKNGVLTVSVPKSEDASKETKIDIKAA